MTELETMQRAKMYMDKLAGGIDPITNQAIQDDSVLNHVRLSRCFTYVSDVLERVIANGGEIGVKPRLQPFRITAEALAAVQVSRKPVRITQLVDMICEAVGDPRMKKLRTTVITDWLIEKGFMEKQELPDGRSRRVPTQRGLALGISVQNREGKDGMYQVVSYHTQAQRFVLEHLPEMLADNS